MVHGAIEKASTRNAQEQVQEAQKSDYYKYLQKQLAQKAEDNRGIWLKVTDAKGKSSYHIDVSTLSSQADFTQVTTHDKLVKAPTVIKALGYKIDIQKQAENLMESYGKSCIQSRSHNLIMAKLGGLKMAALGHLLSLLGMTSEDLQKLQKKAIKQAMDENKSLFEENLYNMELLDIVGAGGKQGRSQKIVLEEVQKQILTQAKLLGIGDFYTKERIFEMRIKVCKDILYKFKEEEVNLKYELEYLT
ncbi:MAG: hypothetical protein KKA19_01755 [Candidatus Margulisbacteria bacterium]|nr:hypothetical protein [Candidatus Margulisiibacteriota bacterium]